jgi:hypothetical protein
MNTVQRILKQRTPQHCFAAPVVVSILGLALIIFIVWILGDVVFGKYSLALSRIFDVFA